MYMKLSEYAAGLCCFSHFSYTSMRMLSNNKKEASNLQQWVMYYVFNVRGIFMQESTIKVYIYILYSKFETVEPYLRAGGWDIPKIILIQKSMLCPKVWSKRAIATVMYFWQ